MYKKFNINKKIIDFVNDVENDCLNSFFTFEKIYENNQLKVLNAFINNKVSESHFIETTGYGYNDIGRDKIEEVYCEIFNTEDALVRQQIVSGTHAISLVLFALTHYGDKILSINGLPYDTIHSTLGLHNEKSSLREYGIDFDYVDLVNDDFDYNTIKTKLTNDVKIIMIQRSRGYSERKALSIKKIKKVIDFIKEINTKVIVFVDNCYGEFVSEYEPTDVGADIICGSLIKNPGGSIVKAGGYIVGKKDLIEKCSYRLTAPGIGKEVGISYGENRNILQGLYFAPQIVNNACKIAKLFTNAYSKLGFDTVPNINDSIDDIVVSIKLNNESNIINFCKSIQCTSPIDSFVNPTSSEMPGYDSKVIMAAGNFISGASLELSCDAPIREPYVAYLQGGISYYQGKLALMKSIQELNLIK